MNIQDCYRILQVPQGAGLDEVKSAFRRQAFQLHPDLNPSPKAAEQFRRLNEAYVLLTHALKDGGARFGDEGPRPGRPDARTEADDAQSRARKAKAEKAYAKQRASAGGAGPSASGPGTGGRSGSFYFKEEEVLRDLLSDPFARQVFEDIYSQLKTGKPGAAGPAGKAFGATPAPGGDPEKRRRLNIQWGEKSVDLDMSRGIIGGIKDWLRGQLDFEQTVHYPAHALGPGRALRLTVSPRFGEPRTVELTLPPDFVPGRPIRLKGLGRKLGPFTGDLILRVLAR